jgi:hypothetical protein
MALPRTQPLPLAALDMVRAVCVGPVGSAIAIAVAAESEAVGKAVGRRCYPLLPTMTRCGSSAAAVTGRHFARHLHALAAAAFGCTVKATPI